MQGWGGLGCGGPFEPGKEQSNHQKSQAQSWLGIARAGYVALVGEKGSGTLSLLTQLGV